MRLSIKTLVLMSSVTLFTAGIYAKPVISRSNIPTNGIMLGAQAGYYNNDAVPGAAAVSSSTGGLGGRLFAGYQFTQNLAIEMGIDRFANTSDSGDKLFGPDHYKLNGYDVAGRFIYPFVSGFALYGKLGAAVIRQDVYNQVFIGTKPLVDTDTTRVLPLIGVGIAYNFNQHFALDLSWTHFQRMNEIRNIDFIPLGITFTFG